MFINYLHNQVSGMSWNYKVFITYNKYKFTKIYNIIQIISYIYLNEEKIFNELKDFKYF